MEIPQIDGVIITKSPSKQMDVDTDAPSLSHLIQTTAKLCRDTDRELFLEAEYTDPVTDRVRSYILSFD